MTDEFVQMLKEILDKAGVEISMEQLEAGLNAMADDAPKEDPWLDEAFRKIEEERKAKGADEEDHKGISMRDWGNAYVVSGPATVEFNGRTVKKSEGEAVLLLKPDNSIVIHGLHGVKPLGYLARADEIRSRGSNRTFTVEAAAGNDRLTVTFQKICAFESLFKELPRELRRPRTDKPASAKTADRPDELSEEEKSLETRLKKLRIDLAQSNGSSYLPAVFDNRMLHALVKLRPATKDELKRVRGFGDKRIEKYGGPILQAIREASAASA
ncbi:MAG: hypothetical protein A4E28_03276 [Methanocella sp. PtaU1.Bin125]|nr:MAG: hypothetical protein A4E28_03276 [Methanocella sp. PtaU1.Bin125]